MNKYSYNFYAFGSRVQGTAQKLSDLDLCYKEEIPLHEVQEIREALEESELPFTVDLVSWQECSVEFQQRIAPQLTDIRKLW